MSGGGGGIIIIHSLASLPECPFDLRKELLQISNRSPIRVSFSDKVAVCRIVWKMLTK